MKNPRWKRYGGVLIVAFYLLAAALEVGAVEFKGVAFPDELSIGGTKCLLNGIGVRKKFFISVYYGAFYSKAKVSDAETAIRSDQPKGIVIHVVYKQVDPEKWTEGWKEGFSKNVPQPSETLKKKIDTFIQYFTDPVKRGEEVRLLYEPGIGTRVIIRGVEKGVVPGTDFMEALWKIYFGPHPASESLKEAMLGQS